jgi:hypothetical protein
MSSPLPTLDDAAAMAVLADALCECGDPRGELIHLQLAREGHPRDARLAREEERHLASHARALLGPLRTATSLCALTWRRGFIVEAKLYSRSTEAFEFRAGSYRQLDSPPRLPRVVRDLLALESACVLRDLQVLLPRSPPALKHLLWCVDELARARPATLRRLVLGLTELFADGEEVLPTYDFEKDVGGLRLVTTAHLQQDLLRRLDGVGAGAPR